MTATDIFSNTGGSVDWYEFLNFIGEKVRLKGWNRFAGGLDVKTDTTGTATFSLSLSPSRHLHLPPPRWLISGEFSRFTEWQGSEIMWHVATMLPQGEGAQQIARKRHIGNDICILVFLDGTVLLLPLFLSPFHLPVSTSSGGGVRRPTPFSLSLSLFFF
jgi:hypothetical protein